MAGPLRGEGVVSITRGERTGNHFISMISFS